MKYCKIFISILLICILFSGCSFRMSSSIDDLMSPVSPFGDDADIQEAMDAYAKPGYSLKTPNAGSHNSSYNFYDINGDGQEEAFAFYEPADRLGAIDLAVFQKIDSQWQAVENIDGDGKDVYSLDFCDVNNDGKTEILICWNAISNSSNHYLTVYRYNDKNNTIKLEAIDKPISINNYVCVDLNNDGKQELLLFEIKSGTTSTVKAELYSLSKNKFDYLGETKLDRSVSSYNLIQIEKAEGDVRVYADALGSDGASMVTEVIYWSNGYGTIVSPFYSYSTGVTADTRRSAMLSCKDINDDKLIEIPTDMEMKKLPHQVSAVDWKIYKNTTLIHTDYSLFVEDDRYYVIIPDKMMKNISVSYDENTRLMTVSDKSSKNEIFSVIPVLKAKYSKEDYKGYTKILDASGYYYLAKLGNDSNINITIDDLKNNIKSVD